MDLNTALDNFVVNPENAKCNFNLAIAYENKEQLASAISFFIRTAELSHSDLLSYESLLRVGVCFDKAGSRSKMAEGAFLRAASLLPERPEAYFLLSQHYERTHQWMESYFYARLGETIPPVDKLMTDFEFFGVDAFRFQRGVSAWNIGQYMEALDIFRSMENTPMPESFAAPVKNNIVNLNTILTGGLNYTRDKSNRADYPSMPSYLYKYFSKYYFSQYESLRLKFPGSADIQENFSQAFQDMFVLGMLNGKRNGVFVEIGCNVPVYNNNTFLLEKDFGWSGVAIDINPLVTELYSKERKSKVVTSDAVKVDYNDLLKDYGDIDYLQIDCEPATVSYRTLLKIPFEKHRFAVITFEHDYYIDQNREIREQSRKYLRSLGYECLIPNVGFSKHAPFEDWWVYPELVDINALLTMRAVDEQKRIDGYIMDQK